VVPIGPIFRLLGCFSMWWETLSIPSTDEQLLHFICLQTLVARHLFAILFLQSTDGCNQVTAATIFSLPWYASDHGLVETCRGATAPLATMYVLCRFHQIKSFGAQLHWHPILCLTLKLWMPWKPSSWVASKWMCDYRTLFYNCCTK